MSKSNNVRRSFNLKIPPHLPLLKGGIPLWKKGSPKSRRLFGVKVEGLGEIFIKSVLVLFSLLISLTPVFADEYHYNNILIGERASGMGGAYTAVADDTGGLYYNPAGIVYGTGRNLSGSVNAYHITQKHYKGVIGGYGWKREASSLLPNFFGIIQPLGKGKVGFSYAVPDSIMEDQDEEFYNLPSTIQGATVTRYVINFNNEDEAYNFGPSYAQELFKDFSAGITLYVHRRQAQRILNQLVDLSTGQQQWLNSYYETTELGIRPVLGLLWSPIERLAFGIKLSKTMILSSDTTLQSTWREHDAPPVEIIDDGIGNDDGMCETGERCTTPIRRTVTETDKKRKYPLAATIGAAYFVSDSLLFSGDFSYHTKSGDDTFGKKETTWDAAIGAEYYISKSLALRLGFFTNRSNHPELEAGVSGQTGVFSGLPEHIDLYGGSLSLSLFARNSAITLGSSYSYGTGEAQVVGGSPAIQDTQDTKMQSLTIFLSSTYSY